jgi:hypothetical protein
LAKEDRSEDGDDDTEAAVATALAFVKAAAAAAAGNFMAPKSIAAVAADAVDTHEIRVEVMG